MNQVAPDIETASADYARRFSSVSGEWLLQVQSTGIKVLLKRCFKVGTALDVGAGHGQLIDTLIEAGYKLSIHASTEQCFELIRPRIEANKIEIIVSPCLDIAVAARQFDLVTSVRLLSHISDWRRLIGELCRIANEAVIIDYPVNCSINALTPLLFNLKRSLEGNTRSYTLFNESEVIREFRRHGFVLADRYAQFFWPMVLHRALKNRSLSRLLESVPRLIGLSRLFGSPVLGVFVRERSTQ